MHSTHLISSLFYTHLPHTVTYFGVLPNTFSCNTYSSDDSTITILL